MGDKPPNQRKANNSSEPEDADEHNNILISRFSCSDCEERFLERNTFNEHLEARHPRAPVVHLCQQCGVELSSFEELRRHTTERHSNSQIFNCTMCRVWFWNSRALEFHLERHQAHRGRRTCGVCHRLLPSRRQFRDHKKAGHGPWVREFQCAVCGGRFCRDYKKFRQQQEALKKDGKTRRWVPMCQRCGKIFSSKLFLDKHNCDDKPDDAENGRPVCNGCACGNGKGPQEQATREEKKDKDAEPYECEICGKKFSKPENLKKHKRVHENTDPGVVCDKCHRVYRNQEVLRRHRRTCGEPVPGPSHAPD